MRTHFFSRFPPPSIFSELIKKGNFPELLIYILPAPELASSSSESQCHENKALELSDEHEKDEVKSDKESKDPLDTPTSSQKLSTQGEITGQMIVHCK